MAKLRSQKGLESWQQERIIMKGEEQRAKTPMLIAGGKRLQIRNSFHLFEKTLKLWI